MERVVVVFAFSIEFLCSHSVNLILDNFAKIVDNANNTHGQSKRKYLGDSGCHPVWDVLHCTCYCNCY